MEKEYLMMLIEFYAKACVSYTTYPTEYMAQAKEEWRVKIKEAIDSMCPEEV